MGGQWKQKKKLAAAGTRGKLFGKLTKEIMMAARGGANPDMNAGLRMALEAARKQSVPRDTVERAIKKGAGLLDGPVNFETVTYEGFAPHQVAIIVECVTDNKNRTASSMRVLFRGGQLGASGSVSWDFLRCGLIEAPAHAQGEEAEEAAIEAGADDVSVDDEGLCSFQTAPEDLHAVNTALTERGWTAESCALVWTPKNPMTLEPEALAEVEEWLERMDDDDDVQKIFVALG
ncbi:MAG: YebC/PmpR family DNA-binding transcriptional regulator [Deltaproteobacteria bacterium]|nr:YebC/PmpR family DNA-binding transcriptional regulator [Deltaproteobacteria bacterium]